MDDYLKNLLIANVQTNTRDKETKLIFLTWNNFKIKIYYMFGDIDEERTAKRNLEDLRQKGACTAYAAKFQSLAFRTS